MIGEATVNFQPEGSYDARVYDVTYREDQDGAWQARIYQPEGRGPFPAILDVHGGAWNRGSYTSNESIDRKLAASGLFVAAITLRGAPKYPYPSQVADVNYATRWLKARAGYFNADARRLGGLGTSSGGHTIMLSAMRPPMNRAIAFCRCWKRETSTQVSHTSSRPGLCWIRMRATFTREASAMPNSANQPKHTFGPRRR